MNSVLARVALLLACAFPVGAAEISPIQVQQFFQNPAITGASISPDGRHVLLRMLSTAGRSMLTVIDVETHAQKTVANYSNADVENFYWISDRRLAYVLVNVEQGGDIGVPGLYAVDHDGKDFASLTVVLNQGRSFADTNADGSGYLGRYSVNGFPYRKTESMYVMEVSRKHRSLGLIDTRTGKRTPVDAPSNATNWLLEPNGDVRIVVTSRDGKDTLHYKEAGAWREIGPADDFTPVLYVDGTLYVQARNGHDESSVYRYDLEHKAILPKPVIAVPGYDTRGYFVLDDHRVLGYRLNTDSENTIWIDPARKAMQDEIDALLPNTINTTSYGAHSETPYVLVDTYRDTQDHIYVLYNRETRQLLRLGAAHADLDVARMAPMSMVRYPARDGMQIPAYVTLPNAEPRKPLPTVVLIGDKQWLRGADWAWNASVQFLASRGYVVLQPEPRGVHGFGSAHEKAGKKQWGLAIQDDIADAVKWAVAQGYTDPARVCIAGGGYGGYAAMMGLIRDPAVFKCGISWSGITDLRAMFVHQWKDTADAGSLPYLRANIGDPLYDTAQFKETSPLQNAKRITQPVLLAYGKNDQRVPFSEGRKFYEALAATNPGAEWLEYTPSTEDWKTQANRIDLWRHIETFLARHIGK